MYPQGQYPPQPLYPQAPQGYPQAPAYPMAPPAQYPPQPYAQPMQYPAAPPPPPPPSGTLDDFFDQRSNAGPSWKFKDKAIGTAYVGTVARPITNADVQAQTDQGGNVQRFRDGRPKFVMIVPMMFPPTAEHPDGQAGWYVKGQARDELARAMAEAGAPAGVPEAGATIRVTLTGHRQIPGFNPAFVYKVEYFRPQGAGAPVQQVPAQAAPMQEYAFAQQAQAPMPPQAPVYQQPPMPQQIPAQVPNLAAMPMQAPVPVPAAVAPPAMDPAAMTAAMSREQQELFARLTGQTQG